MDIQPNLSAGWVVQEHEHCLSAVPAQDLIDHEADSDECVCGPRVVLTTGKIVIAHCSLDGREAHERQFVWPEGTL